MSELTLPHHYPDNGLDTKFDGIWDKFSQLTYTLETLNSWKTRIKRWLTPVNISFIIPLEDQGVCNYLRDLQQRLRPYFNYDPQPADKLHITLSQIGYLRQIPFPIRIPGMMDRRDLDQIARLARDYLQLLSPFEVTIGGINAFPNVAIAEVHDHGKLAYLRGIISQTMPMFAIPSHYPLIPHVTLGYFGARPTAPIRQAIQTLRHHHRIPFKVEQVELTLYYRNRGNYPPKQCLQNFTEDILYRLPLGG